MSSIKVSWKNPNEYKNQPAKKQEVETDVKDSSQSSAAERKGATEAIIRGGIHKSQPGGDQKEHVTVDYKKADGDHVTTKHVYVNP
ncbi:hypothetical protein DAEQUDRAFT_766328 [Daedalea quercina L-15889]|uniref:Uncharacterized protein n=1 Tax=Daedalea quercina L-15889 TaxID=1314783 RepID=A0A165PQX9_9APHY|nr:hypothetical protein DAEQUDRAFT_766328 [Daedalea quercina L-15889]